MTNLPQDSVTWSWQDRATNLPQDSVTWSWQDRATNLPQDSEPTPGQCHVVMAGLSQVT